MGLLDFVRKIKSSGNCEDLKGRKRIQGTETSRKASGSRFCKGERQEG